MKLVVQRVDEARVTVDEKVVGEIKKGFMVLIGVTHDDTYETADYLVNKLCHLRVFQDENSKMNLSIKDVDGELLIVSQFTLYADCQKVIDQALLTVQNLNMQMNYMSIL